MASPDDSVYQDNPYGTTDPTALFQHFSDENSKNYQTGGINQGLAVAGMNPALQHTRAVQSNLSAILAGNQPEEGEDPLDTQMRQARAVSLGMAKLDPQIAIRADQQMLRLEQAKKQQDSLQSETRLRKAEATATEQKLASDPMVWVQQGKDMINGMPIPNITQVGKPINRTDENGNPRTGWSTDLTNELQANGGFKQGMMAMPQSEFLAQQAKLNEGRNAVMAQSAYLRYLGMVQAAQVRAQATQGAPLDPQTLHTAAIETAYDPKTITLYAAGQGGNQRKGEIADERTRWMTQNGIEPEDLAGWRANIHAAAKTQGVMQTNLAQLSVAEQLLNYNGNRVMALIQDVDFTGIPAVEGMRRYLERQGGYSREQMNQKINELNSALVAYRAETARVISGNPNMTGVLSDTARHEIEAVAKENLDAPSMINNIKRSMAEVEFKKAGYINQMRALTGTMRAMPGQQAPAALERPSPTAGAGPTVAPTPPAAGPIPSTSGLVRMVSPDGKQRGTVPAAGVAEAEQNGWKRE